jgi:hypothetical protein
MATIIQSQGYYLRWRTWSEQPHLIQPIGTSIKFLKNAGAPKTGKGTAAKASYNIPLKYAVFNFAPHREANYAQPCLLFAAYYNRIRASYSTKGIGMHSRFKYEDAARKS